MISEGSDRKIVEEVDGKEKEWKDRQYEIFSKAHLPCSEYYNLYWGAVGDSVMIDESELNGSSEEEMNRRLFHCREVDPHFSHEHFQLPVDKLKACIEAYRWIDTYFSEQLQHDLDQQQLLQVIIMEKEEDSGKKKTRIHSESDPAGSANNLCSMPPTPALPPLTHVGGMDISFLPQDPHRGVMCLTVLRYPSLDVVKVFLEECTLAEEYVVGYLAFREAPLLCKLWENALPEMVRDDCVPQLMIVDGCGTHHTRRAGLAVHLGVLLNIPTIGCAKNMLMVGGVGADEVIHAVAKKKAWWMLHGKLKTSRREEGKGGENEKGEEVEVGDEEKSSFYSLLAQFLPCALAAPPSLPMSCTLTISFSPQDHVMKGKSLRSRQPLSSRQRSCTAPSLVSRTSIPEGSSWLPVIYPIVSHSSPPILYGYALMSSASPKKCTFISPGHHVGYAMSVAMVLTMCCHRIPEPTRLADFYSRELIRQVVKKGVHPPSSS